MLEPRVGLLGGDLRSASSSRRSSRAVVLHKDAGERRLAGVLGALLAEQIAAEWPGWA